MLTKQEAMKEWRTGQSGAEATGDDVWKNYFQQYINSIPYFINGSYFWQIYSFRENNTTIMDVGGVCEELTPFSKKEFCKLSMEELFQIFHPEDLPHLFTFIAKVVEFLTSMEISERQKFHLTIYARVKNAAGVYSWNALHYPAFYFDSAGALMYGMVVYTDISHLKTDNQLPILTILDRTTASQKQVFTCYFSGVDQKVQLIHPIVSKREKDVLELLSEGLASKEIAARLGIAKNTLENHRQRLLKKFGATSSIDLLKKLNRFIVYKKLRKIFPEFLFKGYASFP